MPASMRILALNSQEGTTWNRLVTYLCTSIEAAFLGKAWKRQRRSRSTRKLARKRCRLQSKSFARVSQQSSRCISITAADFASRKTPTTCIFGSYSGFYFGLWITSTITSSTGQCWNRKRPRVWLPLRLPRAEFRTLPQKKPDHSHPACHHSKNKGNVYDGLYEY